MSTGRSNYARRMDETHGSRSRFLGGSGPIAFAHRGGTESAPENSLAAFRAAVEMGFRYLETDVHLSADGTVIAAHDEDLSRMAGHAARIEDLNTREIAELRLGGTEPIPHFLELAESFPESMLNVDPKSDAVVEPLIRIIRERDLVDRICIGTFSDERLERIREEFGSALCTSAGPRETRRLVTSAKAPGGVRRSRRSAVPYQCLQVPVQHKRVTIVTPRFIKVAHAAGVQVHVWTIDDPQEMNRLLDMGVDGLMTDRPSVLREVLRARGQWD